MLAFAQAVDEAIKSGESAVVIVDSHVLLGIPDIVAMLNAVVVIDATDAESRKVVYVTANTIALFVSAVKKGA